MKFIHNILLIALTLLSCNVSNAFYVSWKFNLPWIHWGDRPKTVTPGGGNNVNDNYKNAQPKIQIEYHGEDKHGTVTVVYSGVKHVIGLIDISNFSTHMNNIIGGKVDNDAILVDSGNRIVTNGVVFDLLKLPFNIFIGDSILAIDSGVSYVIANQELYINTVDGITKKIGALPKAPKTPSKDAQPMPDNIEINLGKANHKTYYYIKASNKKDTYYVYTASDTTSKTCIGEVSKDKLYELRSNNTNQATKVLEEREHFADLMKVFNTSELPVTISM